jgi:hypothetical protein
METRLERKRKPNDLATTRRDLVTWRESVKYPLVLRELRQTKSPIRAVQGTNQCEQVVELAQRRKHHHNQPKQGQMVVPNWIHPW